METYILKIHAYIRIFPLSRLSFVLGQPRPLRIFSAKEEGGKEELKKKKKKLKRRKNYSWDEIGMG